MRVGIGPVALLLLALVPWSGAGAEERAAVAWATTVVGDVAFERNGATRALDAGAALFIGDAVGMAGGARASLAFLDRSVVVLGAFTRVTIEAYVPRERGLAGLLRGIVRATVGTLGPDSAFEIETSTSVTSVRGTEWIVDAQPASTAVFVESGRVRVTGVGAAAHQDVVLEAGEGTTVASGASPAPPARWGAARVADVRARAELR